ncbi:tRNA dihydrouridine synthase B [Aquitalea magnusonii]|uniref:tRNA-dihydrouridine synthase B n=1 Tax=Aquitalea magnusonii TaxID=332411 RepID=A0A3G9GHJ7_9NEIS|nr:tRNA dihydrouridine synthase DusB [Aquitalea magnusonii]BBF87348.1 tRNA dihydrouridine synthase B [Aquitalea magnusonii]
MRIGPYTLKNRLIVAPMAGVTDRPFRMLCKKMGAAMAVSEMITSNKSLWATAKTLRRADHAGEVEPISVQIAGSDPQQMAEAARINVEQGAQIIDINMGCPAKKVCNVAAGSALLRDEALVGRILEAVVKAVDVPVTLKTRTGWSPEHRNALRIARLAEDCGIAALALHGRTREDMYRGDAEYDTIRAVKASIGIPLIANGDIDTPQKAQQVLQYTGADAVMIGRAAQGRPWIFREMQHYLETGQLLPPPRVMEIRQLLLEHLDDLYGFYGEYSGCRIARKHIAWYTRGLRGSNTFRQAMYQLEETGRQRQAVAGYFDQLAAQSERLEYEALLAEDAAPV